MSLIDIEVIADKKIKEKDITSINLIFINPEKVLETKDIDLIKYYLYDLDLAVHENAPNLLKEYYDLYFTKHKNKYPYEKVHFMKLTLN